MTFRNVTNARARALRRLCETKTHHLTFEEDVGVDLSTQNPFDMIACSIVAVSAFGRGHYVQCVCLESLVTCEAPAVGKTAFCSTRDSSGNAIIF